MFLLLAKLSKNSLMLPCVQKPSEWIVLLGAVNSGRRSVSEYVRGTGWSGCLPALCSVLKLCNTSSQLKSVLILVIVGFDGTWWREFISDVKVTISPVARVGMCTLYVGTLNVSPLGLLQS